MAPKLSVVVNTHNEADILYRALTSIKNIASEIIIVDMESSDDVLGVAKKFNAKVFKHKKLNFVEPARNFGISKATGDWILVLDPDEEISVSLAKKIKELIESNDADYYRIPRKNIIFGKWIEHASWWPDYQTRLFRKGKISWSEVIHSVPTTLGTGYDLNVTERFAIIHHNYDTLEQYLDKLNRYTSVQAGFIAQGGDKFDWKNFISKPTKEFISRYFTSYGYKDGLHGLLLSLMQAFSELIVCAKVWQAQKFIERSLKVSEVVTQMVNNEKDIHFWQNDALYKETGNLGARIKRKLRI